MTHTITAGCQYIREGVQSHVAQRGQLNSLKKHVQRYDVQVITPVKSGSLQVAGAALKSYRPALACMFLYVNIQGSDIAYTKQEQAVYLTYAYALNTSYLLIITQIASSYGPYAGNR